jgi:hypothetical protein
VREGNVAMVVYVEPSGFAVLTAYHVHEKRCLVERSDGLRVNLHLRSDHPRLRVAATLTSYRADPALVPAYLVSQAIQSACTTLREAVAA